MYCSVSIVYYLKLPVGADAAPLSSLELDIVIRVVNCYDRSDFEKWCQFPKLPFLPLFDKLSECYCREGGECAHTNCVPNGHPSQPTKTFLELCDDTM